MVYLSSTLLKQGRKIRDLRFDQTWKDRIRIFAMGGTGGNGIPKVGGIGGPGGNVIVEADSKVKNLDKILKQHPTKRVRAEDGGSSRNTRLIGEIGESVTVKVPIGITITTDDGEQIADLCKNGDNFVVAKGGMGGVQASQFLGSVGEKRPLRLNLKLLGDVGFVGFPNAGKSTLLKAISRASPKIANYPFTTLRPNVGVSEFEDFRRISFVDLPGLIEGAHQNIGMGHAFLKHVERTRILLFVVDINGFQFKPNSPVRSAIETIIILNKELELYKKEMLDKPAICAITKMDSKGSEKKLNELKEALSDIKNVITDPNVINPEFVPERLMDFSDVVPISAKFSPKTVEYLKFQVRNTMDRYESRENEKLLQELETQISTKLSDKSNIF